LSSHLFLFFILPFSLPSSFLVSHLLYIFYVSSGYKFPYFLTLFHPFAFCAIQTTYFLVDFPTNSHHEHPRIFDEAENPPHLISLFCNVNIYHFPSSFKCSLHFFLTYVFWKIINVPCSLDHFLRLELT